MSQNTTLVANDTASDSQVQQSPYQIENGIQITPEYLEQKQFLLLMEIVKTIGAVAALALVIFLAGKLYYNYYIRNLRKKQVKTSQIIDEAMIVKDTERGLMLEKEEEIFSEEFSQSYSEMFYPYTLPEADELIFDMSSYKDNLEKVCNIINDLYNEHVMHEASAGIITYTGDQNKRKLMRKLLMFQRILHPFSKLVVTFRNTVALNKKIDPIEKLPQETISKFEAAIEQCTVLHAALEVFTNFKKELNFEKDYKVDDEEDAKPLKKTIRIAVSQQTQYVSMLVILKDTFKEVHAVFEKISFLEMFGRQQDPHKYSKDTLLLELLFSMHNYFSFQLKFFFGVFGDEKKTLVQTLNGLKEKFQNSPMLIEVLSFENIPEGEFSKKVKPLKILLLAQSHGYGSLEEKMKIECAKILAIYNKMALAEAKFKDQVLFDEQSDEIRMQLKAAEVLREQSQRLFQGYVEYIFSFKQVGTVIQEEEIDREIQTPPEQIEELKETVVQNQKTKFPQNRSINYLPTEEAYFTEYLNNAETKPDSQGQVEKEVQIQLYTEEAQQNNQNKPNNLESLIKQRMSATPAAMQQERLANFEQESDTPYISPFTQKSPNDNQEGFNLLSSPSLAQQNLILGSFEGPGKQFFSEQHHVDSIPTVQSVPHVAQQRTGQFKPLEIQQNVPSHSSFNNSFRNQTAQPKYQQPSQVNHQQPALRFAGREITGSGDRFSQMAQQFYKEGMITVEDQRVSLKADMPVQLRKLQMQTIMDQDPSLYNIQFERNAHGPINNEDY